MDPRCENIHPTVFKNEILDTSRNKKYFLHEPKLGRGGYAYVYLATDIETKEQFACKVLNRKLLDNISMREKTAKEIVLHSEMDHKYILKFYSYFEDDNNVYMILEYCKHGSLADLMCRGKIFTEDETRVIMKQVLDGIRYIHFKNIMHLDIKPHNIFIHEDMTLKIGDFGLATPIEYPGFKRTVVCGTPKYVAPQVLTGQGYSYEVDAWSLGVTIYHLLLGCSPFDSGKLAPYELIVKGNYRKIPAGTISEEAIDLIASLFVVNDQERTTISGIINSKFMRKWERYPTTLPMTILDCSNKLEVNASAVPISEPQLQPNIRSSSSSSEPLKKISKKEPAVMSTSHPQLELHFQPNTKAEHLVKHAPAPEPQFQLDIRSSSSTLEPWKKTFKKAHLMRHGSAPELKLLEPKIKSSSPKPPKKFFKGTRFIKPSRGTPVLGRILPLKPVIHLRRKPAQKRPRFPAVR